MPSYPRLDPDGLTHYTEEIKTKIDEAAIQILDSDGVSMPNRNHLQFDGMNVDDDPDVDKTIVHGQLKVCSTKAEWDALSSTEKNDPNIYWVRPWVDSGIAAYLSDKTPVGTVISSAADETLVSNPFPTDDYLLCDGTVYNIADYPKLAEYIGDAYGSVNYFGGDGVDVFAVPDFTTDYPTNGVLAIKAKITTTETVVGNIDDDAVMEENVWSAKKINDELESVAEDAKVVVITTSAFSALPQTVTNDKISENHVVINSALSNPIAQISDWTVNTTNGSLIISGSISGNTTLTLYLGLA